MGLLFVGYIYCTALARDRLGWESKPGNLVWLLVIPVSAGVLALQIVVYGRLADSSPLNDPIAILIVLGQEVACLVVMLYYVATRGASSRSLPR